MTQTKHPKAFGFQPGFTFSVTAAGVAGSVVIEPAARTSANVVYVAWMEPASCALKVGITGGTLWGRWAGIVRVYNAVRGVVRLKSNEWEDQRRFHFHSSGQQVTVWFKNAEKAAIGYASAEGFPEVSLAEAEERFLDWYYAPRFGQPLGPRRL